MIQFSVPKMDIFFTKCAFEYRDSILQSSNNLQKYMFFFFQLPVSKTVVITNKKSETISKCIFKIVICKQLPQAGLKLAALGLLEKRLDLSPREVRWYQ